MSMYPRLVLVVAAVVSLGGCVTARPSSPVCLAGAHLDNRGRCQPQTAPVHHIPFHEGTEVKAMQGFHGYASHKESLAFAVDFACEEGTPIVASRAGRVWDLKKDSNTGCADESCVHDANYVILDHGDGTYSEYYHLQHRGVVVEVGDQVCAGQVIGLCGNTGFSSGPHLHFSVSNATSHTVPFQFVEARRRRYGFVIPEVVYRSENGRELTCGETRYSPLPRDAFAHQGIVLGRRLSSTVSSDDHREMAIEGIYFGDHSHVAVHRKPQKGGQWTVQCVAVDERGRFRTTVGWAEEDYPEGYYWMMVTGSDSRCRRAPGWSWSYKIRVD